MGLFARLVVITLGIMSVTSLVVMVERMVVFRKSRRDSRNFAEKMGAILRQGRPRPRRPTRTWARTWATWAA